MGRYLLGAIWKFIRMILKTSLTQNAPNYMYAQTLRQGITKTHKN
jgi:hypothetical protein